MSEDRSPSPVSPPAQRMRAADRAADLLGVTVTSAGDGTSEVSMTVGPDADNGLGMCHGGLLFTLADMAMAYASNGGTRRSVATGGTVEFLKAVPIGAVLTARCTTPQRRGRNAIHDIEIVDPEGDVVVVFRGRTLAVGDQSAE